MLAMTALLTACGPEQPSAISSDTASGCWEIVPGPEPDAPLVDVTAAHAVSPGDIWAVGQTGSAGGDVSRTLAMHWDGKKLNIVPVPGPASKAFLHETVALPNGDVWAVGESVDNPAKRQTLLMKWTGEQWTIYPSALPDADARLQGVASAGGSLWAVGSQTVGGKSKPLFLRYTGSPCR